MFVCRNNTGNNKGNTNMSTTTDQHLDPTIEPVFAGQLNDLIVKSTTALEKLNAKTDADSIRKIKNEFEIGLGLLFDEKLEPYINKKQSNFTRKVVSSIETKKSVLLNLFAELINTKFRNEGSLTVTVLLEDRHDREKILPGVAVEEQQMLTVKYEEQDVTGMVATLRGVQNDVIDSVFRLAPMHIMQADGSTKVITRTISGV